MHGGWTSDSGHKLKQRRSKLVIKEKLACCEESEEVELLMQSLSLQVFKTRLDKALSNLVWFHG